MDGYGIPNSFDKEEQTSANENTTPDNTSGNFATGNFNTEYSYGYPYGATITSDYGYSYSAEDINNSDFSYDADTPSGTDYQNTDTSYFENSDPPKQSNDSNASNSSDDSEGPSSENGMKHMIDIMKAALPHLDSSTQESASLLIKTSELMDSMRSARSPDHISAFSLHRQNIDIEALLTSIRNVCYARERQLIDNILNFIRMKNMFDTYSTLSSMMSSQSNETDTKEENKDGTETDGGIFNQNMMDMLSAMLTPEQKSTFDSMSMMFNMMQQ